MGGGYTPTLASQSTADMHYADPYAVPNLPHLNPNQPGAYHDDPSGAFYDPYGGPVPRSIAEPVGPGPESVMMGQYSDMRVASPAPMSMRAPSPGPNAAFGGPPPQLPHMGAPSMRSMSPGPGGAGYPRAVPGPNNNFR
jgi:hypothetical protein